jgi:glycosyltransferase involved in cell wall biosynthesis
LTPERDAGSRATSDAISSLRELGHDVKFLPISDVGDLEAFDLFIASRPGPAVHAIAVHGFRETPTVFFGHDLHFQRMQVSVGSARAEAVRRMEAMCWRAYGVSVYPSDDEAKYVNDFLGMDRAVAAPIYVMDDSDIGIMPKSPTPTCVFVGSAMHEPNQAAVETLLADIWPEIRQQTGASLHLVGDWEVPASLAGEFAIQVHSNLGEPQLNDLVTRSWLTLAPLPFGAGVKRKVIHSLHCGTPVVGTGFAFQGILDSDGGVIGGVLADDAPAIVEAAIELLGNPGACGELAQAGRTWVGRHYSPEAVQQKWGQVIDYALAGFNDRTGGLAEGDS